MPPPRSTVPTSILRVAALLAATVAMTTTAGQAAGDELADVQRLYRAGQSTAALARVDQYLAAKPADAEMRFMKGVLLADQKNDDAAAAVFEKLTEDHPDLVEPYNNLAAIYAGRGDYAKARGTLEQALRTNPSFATAHENLGDVYAAMAGQAYLRAAQLDPGNAVLAPKLTLVRQLLSTSASAAAASATASR